MTDPLSRQDALRILDLPSTADDGAVKRAYRRLARAHHPDAGGDANTFHRLQEAYDVLRGGVAVQPAAPRGRPSRDRSAWTADVARAGGGDVDLGTVDWTTPLADGEVRLDRDTAAVWLAAGGPAPVRALTASSRAPGSRWNRLANVLASDLTSQLRVATVDDDRGRQVVQVEVRGTNRRARRALDTVALEGGWVRTRGSSTTVLRRTLVPTPTQDATAVHVVDAIEALLGRLDWPLPAWTLTRPA